MNLGGEQVMVLAIADGAGSASASDLGSETAVQQLLQAIAEVDRPVKEFDESMARKIFSRVREHLSEIATHSDLQIRDLACTALVAVLGESESVFFQVGDGGWVTEYQGKCEAVTWPKNGEYANETTFLTASNWEADFQYRRWSGSAMSVAGFTDGVQSLALHYASKEAHAPFFSPLFAALHATEDETSLKPPLLEFLDSKPINERTDDDKTLILASRIKLKLLDGAAARI